MMFADLLDALTREGLKDLDASLRYAYARQWRDLEIDCYAANEASLKATGEFDKLRTIRNALSRVRDAVACLPESE